MPAEITSNGCRFATLFKEPDGFLNHASVAIQHKGRGQRPTLEILADGLGGHDDGVISSALVVAKPRYRLDASLRPPEMPTITRWSRYFCSGAR